MTDAPEPPSARRTATEAVADITGLPLGQQFLITIAHTVAFTPRVAKSVINREPGYISPLRLFMLMMGALLGVGAFFDLPIILDLTTLFPPDMHGPLSEFLNARGVSLSEADAEVGRWMSLFFWVTMVVSSLPFLVLLKALAPRLSWWTHAQCYLLANNVMLVITLASTPILFISEPVYIVLQVLIMSVFFIALLRISVGAFRLSTARLAVLIIAIPFLIAVSILVTVLINLIGLHAILSVAYDISLFELFDVGIDAPPQESTP